MTDWTLVHSLDRSWDPCLASKSEAWWDRRSDREADWCSDIASESRKAFCLDWATDRWSAGSTDIQSETVMATELATGWAMATVTALDPRLA